MSQLPDPIEGLTKRQQSKLERILKNSQNKACTHVKSYKRKAAKGKHPEQSSQRKLIKSDANASQQQSESNHSFLFGQPPNEVEVPDKKRAAKLIKPFNPNFVINGGEDCLFEYIMTYAYNEKMKKMEAPAVDCSFLDKVQGQELKILENRKIESKADFEKFRQQIEIPFDETHKDLTRKISRNYQQKS